MYVPPKPGSKVVPPSNKIKARPNSSTDDDDAVKISKGKKKAELVEEDNFDYDVEKDVQDISPVKKSAVNPSNIVVRAFDGSKRMVHWEMGIPVKVGSQTFESTFYVMDIRSSYSCLLGRAWIHGAGDVTSTLHQMLKYPVKGKLSLCTVKRSIW